MRFNPDLGRVRWASILQSILQLGSLPRSPCGEARACRSRKSRCDLAPDFIGSSPKRRICQVCVPLSRGRLSVTEDPADKRKPDPATRTNAGERVPQVVNADIADAGRLAYPTPLLRQAVEMAIRSRGRKHPLCIVVRPLALGRQQVDGSTSQRYDLCAGLAALEPEHPELKVHFGPFQGFNLAATRTRQDEEPDDGCCLARCWRGSGRIKRLTELSDLSGA